MQLFISDILSSFKKKEMSLHLERQKEARCDASFGITWSGTFQKTLTSLTVAMIFAFCSACTTDFSEGYATNSDAGLDSSHSLCGNGILDPGESCDGKDVNGLSCVDLGFTSGNLSCTASCILDTTGCVGPVQPHCSGNCRNCPLITEESMCRGITGCTWQTPGCIGDCDPCATRSGQQACLEQVGCQWDFMTCAGNCLECSYLSGNECNAQQGCAWFPGGCSGTASPCDGRNETECRDGCVWQSAGSCIGQDLDCADISTQNACLDQEGCTWEGNGCTISPFPSQPPECIRMTTQSHCESTTGDCFWSSSTPICVGTAASCAGRTEETCRDGCTWTSQRCSGTCVPCDHFDSQQGCIEQTGCLWTSSATSTCTGACQECSSLPQQQDDCQAQAGCEWIPTARCTGTCRRCDELSTPDECEEQPGCTWNE